MEAIGFYEIMTIEEEDMVYEKDNFQLSMKQVKNGDILLEVETNCNNPNLDCIEKLKQKLLELQIPIDTSDFFVKKAEIEFNKQYRS